MSTMSATGARALPTRAIEASLGDLKQWLPGLIQRVLEKQAKEQVAQPAGPFPIAKQRALGLELMKLLGFDFEGGRLDESAHPLTVAVELRFCGVYAGRENRHGRSFEERCGECPVAAVTSYSHCSLESA